MPVRVVLVDDVPEVRRLVRTALRFRGGFEVVGEAGDGGDAVAMSTSLQPDIVVLDLGLPDLAGREVLTGIRAHSPGTKVVVFSGTETADRLLIAAQVEGFVLKDANLDYLIDLLEAVSRGGAQRATIDLARDLTSVASARRFLRRTFAEWGLGALVDNALVVASELVTNAITHAHSPCQLRLSITATSVRGEVLDAGTG